MKTIKPKYLALLTKIYEYQGRFFLAVNASLFFDFDHPQQLQTEVEMWKLLAKVLGKNTAFDMGVPKQRGEFLVYGKCCDPQGTPVSASTVRVKVGQQQKELLVFGDRHWEQRLGVTTMSGPEPFSEIDLTYANAFGGADYPANPLGKGMPSPTDQVVKLPNIEISGARVLSPSDRPTPAGLGAIDISLPQRMSKAGTYDDKWLKTRFPGYADDIDWSLFNAAPEDQWLPGFFNGDEKIEVSGMHPQKAVQHLTLPSYLATCFITQRTADGEQFREISMHPETLVLLPTDERAILLFRGVTEIRTDDASDVIHLVAGVEQRSTRKKIEHYQEILAIRLDKKKGAMHALDDSPLLPYLVSDARVQESVKSVVSPPAEPDLGERVSATGFPPPTKALEGRPTPAGTTVGLPSVAIPTAPQLPSASDEIMAQAEKTLQEQHTKLLELAKQHALPASVIAGINLAFSKDISLDQLNPNNLDVEAEMQKQQLAAEQRLREICAQHKMDYDALVKSATSAPTEPPKPMADTIMQQLTSVQDKLKAMGKSNADLDRLIAESPAELAALDAKMLESYQQISLPKVDIPAAEKPLEKVVEEKPEQKSPSFVPGGNYAGLDLTGIDLSGLDLREANFSNAILEKANLSRAQLDGAIFAQAMLAHANLDGANLTKANFADAKLDHAQFGSAIAHEANLSKATLSDADFGTADFSRANLTKCNLLNVKLGAANLTGILAQQAKFMQSGPKASFPMHGIRFTGADLTKAVFLNCKMDEADFSGACLERASFVAAVGEKVNFSKARLNKSCMVKESALTGANFTDAELKSVNLRGANLTGAQFANACLEGADLSGCNLQRTDFNRTQATNVRFAKADFGSADLSGANLHKAIMRNSKLGGTRLLATNLYQADMLRSQVDATTVFDQANLKKTLLKSDKK